MTADLLHSLRDIHYPDPVKLWPFAIGWYILIGLFLIIVLGLLFYFYRKWLRQHLKRLVLERLQQLQIQQDNTQLNVAAELSMLLKRAVLAKYPRSQVAGLHSEQWLKFLDETSESDQFSNGPGRILLAYPYMQKQQQIPQSLFHLIQEWVKKNL